jgi:hypothetical protein
MKIIHLGTGEAYQLFPGSELEIERTNPFLNEWGEQSLPLSIPDTDTNRALAGQPHLLSVKDKASQRIPVMIQDEDYSMPAKQAVLSAQRKKEISTSFYMNEGAFYDSMPKTRLRELFGSEIIAGISTVDQALSFCTSLLTTEDERVAIFPVLIDGEEGKDYLNRLAWMDASGQVLGRTTVANHSVAPTFYNSFERTRTVDETVVTIPKGFYITPFIKANYLLKRIFEHFGYTIVDNFFTQTLPFTRMVFLNNTADTLANGVIKLADLVPDCTCETILDVFRKKFHCEFIPDELTKTVNIRLFKQVKAASPSTDLTGCLTDDLIIEQPETYRRIRLRSEESTKDSNQEVAEWDSVTAMLKKYPTTLIDKSDQSFYRQGFALGVYSRDKIGDSSIPYDDGSDLEVEEITVPDSHPVMAGAPQDSATTYSVGGRTAYSPVPMIYIGEAVLRNSTIVYDNSQEVVDESSTSTSDQEQRPMLAFYYDATGLAYMHGTISSYNYLGTTKLWDYSLCYFGEDGLYERFYRDYDNMLRNSMHTVIATLLLSNQLKRTIPAHEKVVISGQELLIDTLKYKVGGPSDPQESTFYTTRLYEPLDLAQGEDDRLATPQYRWQLSVSSVVITQAEYLASPVKDKTYTVFYPPHPTAPGGSYYPQQVARMVNPSEYRLYTYSLTAVAY